MSTFDGQKRLSNPTGVSLGVGLGGVLFGCPFLAAGLFVLALAAGAVPLSSADGQPPPVWVLFAFGSVFAAAGGLIMSAGLRGWLRQRRRDAAFALNPDEPWRGDYPWDPRHAYDRAGNPLPTFGFAVFMTLFLSIFNYFAFADDTPLPVKGFIAFFDLIGLAVWGAGFYVLGRRLKYGATRVRFASFPFLVGHPLRVTLELPRALRDFPELRATLRLAEQKWEKRRSGNKTSHELITYERWAEEQVIPRDRIDGAVTLEFMLPPGAPATDLASPEARYWELQLDAETPGIDYHGLFLMPVY